MVTMSALVAAAHPCSTTVFPIGKQCIPENTKPLAMDAHLLAAAAHLNMIPVVKQLLTSGVWQDKGTARLTSSALLGNAATIAAEAGNSEILSLLIEESLAPPQFLWKSSGDLLMTASFAGHVDAVRLLLKQKRNPDCKDVDFRNYLAFGLTTPSPEVYDMVRAAIHELDGTPIAKRYERELGTDSFFEWVLNNCVKEGWTAMAVYCLDHGVTVNTCRENIAPFIKHSPFANACRRGNIQMVQLLLDRGLDTTYALSYAAASGNLELVNLLLDHGCNPNEGYPRPLAWAVDLEHSEMFILLIKRGAEMELPSTRQDIIARARGQGLESMLALIRERTGIDPYESTYTTPAPAPRPRKPCCMCEP